MYKRRRCLSFKCWSQGRPHRIDVKADAWRMSSISRGMSWGRDLPIKGEWWTHMWRRAAVWSDRVTKMSHWNAGHVQTGSWSETSWMGGQEPKRKGPQIPCHTVEVFSSCRGPMKDFAQDICLTQFLFQKSNLKAHVMSDLRGPGLMAGEQLDVTNWFRQRIWEPKLGCSNKNEENSLRNVLGQDW